jgi:non-homologous end joining protein Ku
LRALIEDNRKGRPVKPQKPANDDKVVDLMAALKKSLEDGADGGRR